MTQRGVLFLALCMLCGPIPRVAVAQDSTRYAVVDAFPSLSFKRPVGLENAGDGSNRLFVVEQDGLIRVVPNDSTVNQAPVFLDLTDRVNTEGNEMGLLGLAFSPDFIQSKTFFVDYTASRRGKRITRVSRLTADGDHADPKSEDSVLELEQPWNNHNGGQLAFGPDRMLYIALGDGGAGGDPHGNAQNREVLLGKILRLDVSRVPYAIPVDNPFRANQEGYREEIFAYGLRNPWRFSFDPATGLLWAGDVGQSTWEEIDVVEKGGNYGWDCREGMHPSEPAERRAPSCAATTGFTDPVWAYGRDQGISITGGFVYRGHGLPGLVGWYVYADYGSGRIWALRIEDGKAHNRLLLESHLLISSFGRDESGELFVCAHDSGGKPTHIYALVAE